MGKLANIPRFDKQFWREVGNEITDEIRVQTQKKGRDVFNQKFKPYKTHTPFWFTKKVNGKTIEYMQKITQQENQNSKEVVEVIK